MLEFKYTIEAIIPKEFLRKTQYLSTKGLQIICVDLGFSSI